MVTVDEFAEDLMRMVWLLLSVMICKPSGVKAQLMQYQVYFVNSSCSPIVWRRCFQPWTASCRLSVVVWIQLCNQSLVYCRLLSTKPIMLFLGDLFIGTHDQTSFIKLFESSHHRNTDEYPFSVGWSCALSKFLGGVLSSILIMAWSYYECSLYLVFDVEEGSWVYPTNLIWYFESTTVESRMIVYDTIKISFVSSWSITRLRKVSRWVSVINSLTIETKSALPPGTPSHWFSHIPLFFTACLVAWFDQKYFSIRL